MVFKFKECRFAAYVSIVVLFLVSGCAAPASDSYSGGPLLPSASAIRQTRPEWLHSSWNLAYSPTVPPGKTYAAALEDIRNALDPPQSGGVYVDDRVRTSGRWFYIEKCSVSDQGIQIQARDQNEHRNVTLSLRFSDLVDHQLLVLEAHENKVKYAVCMHYLMEFYFYKPDRVRAFADALFLIQQQYIEKQDQQLMLTESQTAQYRALPVKPRMSEEQRKYIVQANALNQRKDYNGAIQLYQEVIAIDPMAYPAAYFNLALLSAQQQRFRSAITFMKQYLLLEPEAKDARAARDKIYEWELMIR